MQQSNNTTYISLNIFILYFLDTTKINIQTHLYVKTMKPKHLKL